MDTCDNCGIVAELFHNEASGLAFCESCDAATGNSEPWAIISAEGLTLLVNLSEENAKSITASGTYPPGGDDPGVCYAVPERVARWAADLWRDHQRESARRLRVDCKRTTAALLKRCDAWRTSP